MVFDQSGDMALVVDLAVISMVEPLRETRFHIEEMPDEELARLKRRRWAFACFPVVTIWWFLMGVGFSADYIQSQFDVQVPLAIAISLLILGALSRPTLIESCKLYAAFNHRMNALKHEQASDRNPFGY